MSVLDIRNVSKRFGNLIANDDISLSVEAGEILALLGENGAGKTTLMNILFGHYLADSGSISVFGKLLPPESTDAALSAGLGMVHQHFTLADNMSVLDNIVLGTESLWSLRSNLRSARKKLDDIVTSLQLTIDVDARIADLSIGERQRVEILKALYRNARILILDEPTAVLTPQEVDNLFELLRRMAGEGMSIVIISHKLNEVLAISHRVAVLRHGQLVDTATTGSVNRDELAAMIVGRQVVRPTLEPLVPGESVIALRGISTRDPVTRRPILSDINLNIRGSEIIGLAGVSGNGQTELAGVLSGLVRLSSGTVSFRGGILKKLQPAVLSALNIARIPEDRHAAGVIGDMSVWENLLLEDLGQPPCWRVGGLVIDRGAAKQRAQKLIEAFDIRCANMEIPVSLLSGGNMQKLILARNFQQQPSFVLANQPARGLDEGAIAFVHQQLLDARRQGAGVLLISEDLDELLRLSDRIVVMHDGKLTAPIDTSAVTARDLGVLMTGGSLQNKTADAV